MDFLQVGDAALHYRTVGLDPADLTDDRPVIAFANSLGTDYRIWDAVMATLGSAFSYVLHDKRGHGLSGIGTPPYTIETHADDLAALLDHLKVGKAIVWGLSVGGLIAQSLSVRRPDLVQALVLSNTAHKIGSPEMWDARISAIMSEGLDGMVDPVMERWFTAPFRTADNALYAGCRAMLARQPVDGYCGTCAAIRDADFTEDAPRIAVPTLCIAGDQDGSTPPDLVRSLAALISGSVFAQVSDCGHIPCIEQPDAYAATVAAFLKTLPETKR
ncbi:3-oxoadipate enol-lactonase [Rhizobium sp. PP-F2F-G48]|uniref:3-oxoadipate enol-lactonase n=1 Tax=Rhizobium sp. PP-F2F-G48 TaxID=2135651 RepID=UPI00104E03E9|nr:3-oxoadipate enol-lactonase [Rhizobium sp. PP-F2F-G48]TCM52315.1 3-oxoadipate enol-lactonase [Rhizobium sp. PP-F2F-G48]